VVPLIVMAATGFVAFDAVLGMTSFHLNDNLLTKFANEICFIAAKAKIRERKIIRSFTSQLV
jgi:hypothetical protein